MQKKIPHQQGNNINNHKNQNDNTEGKFQELNLKKKTTQSIQMTSFFYTLKNSLNFKNCS